MPQLGVGDVIALPLSKLLQFATGDVEVSARAPE
jgi:hypothetical protein